MSQLTPAVFIDLPSTWIELAPSDQERVAHDDAVDRMARLSIPPLVPNAVRLLLEQAQATDNSDIAAYYLDAIDDGDGNPYLIAATLNVRMMKLEEMGDIDELDDALRSRVLRGGLIETSRTECDGRQAIRTVAGRPAVDAALEANTLVDPLDVRFYVPVPSMNLLLVVAFLTPNVELADDWIDVFTSIGTTVGLTQLQAVADV